MAICEDAPCCGCCGPSVWAAEARAEEEHREAMLDYFGWDEEEEPEEENFYDGGYEDAAMEGALFGWDA